MLSNVDAGPRCAVTFTVFGVAQPKGSGRAYTYRRRPENGGGIGARVDHDNPKTKGWQQLVAEGASRALASNPAWPFGMLLMGAVRLEAVFYLPRPKSLPRKAEDAEHLKKPDLDKLARSTKDALTGVVWRDDSQVVELDVRKRYAGLGESPRAVVTIEPLSAAERL